MTPGLIALLGVLVILIVALYVAAAVIRGRFISWMLARTERSITQAMDSAFPGSGQAGRDEPKLDAGSLFDAMSGSAPRQPRQWSRAARTKARAQDEPQPDLSAELAALDRKLEK